MKRIPAEEFREHGVPVSLAIAAHREFSERDTVLDMSLIEFDPADPKVVV